MVLALGTAGQLAAQISAPLLPPSASITASAVDANGFIYLAGNLSTGALATLNGTITDNRGKKHAGYTATATIDRTLWGIGPNYPQAVVNNTVTITIEAEAIL